MGLEYFGQWAECAQHTPWGASTCFTAMQKTTAVQQYGANLWVPKLPRVVGGEKGCSAGTAPKELWYSVCVVATLELGLCLRPLPVVFCVLAAAAHRDHAG